MKTLDEIIMRFWYRNECPQRVNGVQRASNRALKIGPTLTKVHVCNLVSKP